MLSKVSYFKFHAWMKLFADRPNEDYIKRTIDNNAYTYRVFLPIIDEEFVEVDNSYVIAFSRLIEKCCSEIDKFVSTNEKIKQMLLDELDEIDGIGKKIKKRVNDYFKQIHNQNSGILEAIFSTNPFHEENNFLDSLNEIIESEGCFIFIESIDRGEFPKNVEGDSLKTLAKQRVLARMITSNIMFVYLECDVSKNSVTSIGAILRHPSSVSCEGMITNPNNHYN